MSRAIEAAGEEEGGGGRDLFNKFLFIAKRPVCWITVCLRLPLACMCWHRRHVRRSSVSKPPSLGDTCLSDVSPPSLRDTCLVVRA
jgi:hypothetical protein